MTLFCPNGINVITITPTLQQTTFPLSIFFMVNYFCDTDNASVVMQQLDDRVVNMYKSIGMILRKYRSGKLPKAFKIIPALNNWEQVGTCVERGGIVVRATFYKILL